MDDFSFAADLLSKCTPPPKQAHSNLTASADSRWASLEDLYLVTENVPVLAPLVADL